MIIQFTKDLEFVRELAQKLSAGNGCVGGNHTMASSPLMSPLDTRVRESSFF